MKNIRDYGAVGDGITDDGAAIQAAIDACGEREWLHVPESIGGYWVGTTTLDSGGKPLTLRGEGQGRAANIYGGGSFIFGQPTGPIFRSLYPGQGCTIVDIGFCNRNTAGTGLELSGNMVTVDRVSMHAYNGIRFATSTFSGALRSVHVRWSGSTLGSVGVALQGHALLNAADIVGFDTGIRACGIGNDIRSCRIEVNKTGIQLGVKPDGSNIGINATVIDGLSLEANDIGIDMKVAATTTIRSVLIQGSANSPSGGSKIGVVAANAQFCTFEQIMCNGSFSDASIRVPVATTPSKWARCTANNTHATGKKWDTVPSPWLLMEQCA